MAFSTLTGKASHADHLSEICHLCWFPLSSLWSFSRTTALSHSLWHAFVFLCLSSLSSLIESEVAQSCPTLSDPRDCSLPGSSIHGIFQARVLEWGAIAFSAHHLGSSLIPCAKATPLEAPIRYIF